MKEITLDIKQRDVTYNRMEDYTYDELETKTYAELQEQFYQTPPPKEVTLRLIEPIKEVSI